MRSSIGYGAYDGFGEDMAKIAPDAKLYKGPTPIRFGRGSVEIKAKGGPGPSYKRYTFEAGMTPFGIMIMLIAGVTLIYFIWKVTGSIFGS